MRDLTDIRKEIDAIDAQLVALFRRRMAIMDEISQAKRAAGIPLTDAAREAAVLERLSAMAPGFETEIHDLYQTIFQLAKKRQSL